MVFRRQGITVPQFATRKIAQITAKVPGVDFEVDALETREQVYDPFLLATWKAEEYYVEIWGDDEKQFIR